MGHRKQKVPECGCVVCLKWNADIETLNDVLASTVYGKRGEAMQKFYARMEANRGCDFCGSENALGLLWIPDAIKDFFGLNRLCVHCRSLINWTRRDHQWPICWGSTSEDEIKWFLVAFVYGEFLRHFDGGGGQFGLWHQCCVEGIHARRAPVKPKPYQWPRYEWLGDVVEDLDIQLRPEFRRPRVRARTIEVTE